MSLDLEHCEFVTGTVLFKDGRQRLTVEVNIRKGVKRHLTLSANTKFLGEANHQKGQKGQTVNLWLVGDVQTGDVVYASLNLR